MGDLIMSAPAIRALKKTFSANITVLTSSLASGIAPMIPEIDDLIIFDLPWVKTNVITDDGSLLSLIDQLKEREFDAAVIFTVFSQNPLPAAMIAYLACIPKRLAYCRENPYYLLTNWVPDKEPYSFIRHQVDRDVALVQHVNAHADDLRLSLNVPASAIDEVNDILHANNLDVGSKWAIFHAGVSEQKRAYPKALWANAARKLIDEAGYKILFTGARSDMELCASIVAQAGDNAYNVAGVFGLQQFAALIKKSPIVVSVNTGPVHIASAVGTPIVVLYAQTNPQHTPWMVDHRVLEFGVPVEQRSKNEVIQQLYKTVYKHSAIMPGATDIYNAVIELIGS